MISFPVGRKPIFALTRFYRSLAVAFSAFAGYCAFKAALGPSALFTFAGVMLLSGACAALNQYQEQRPDGLMQRTENRPLPSRSISPRQAMAAAIALGLAGFLLLYFGTNRVAAALGFFNALWYNIVYTPLKRKTRYAFLIGAIAGALPPLIGYSAAGGRLLGKGSIVALFLYLWQIPHFMLVLLNHGNDYAKAGFPSLSLSMSEHRFRRTIFMGMLAASISSSLFPLFHIISNTIMIVVLGVVNVLFVAYFFNALVLNKKALEFSILFRTMYLFLGCMLALIVGYSRFFA